MTWISETFIGTGDSSIRIRFVFLENLVRWTVAPINESTFTSAKPTHSARLEFDSNIKNATLTNEPKRPPKAPQKTSGTTECHSERQAELSIKSVTANVAPMIIPPAKEASVPVRDTPPFVPGGTTLNVVMRRGGFFDRIPSSEASVSPRQQAK